jgi:hypothetical protein
MTLLPTVKPDRRGFQAVTEALSYVLLTGGERGGDIRRLGSFTCVVRLGEDAWEGTTARGSEWIKEDSPTA